MNWVLNDCVHSYTHKQFTSQSTAAVFSASMSRACLPYPLRTKVASSLCTLNS